NGNLLGKTNTAGSLTITLPASNTEVYVVRAEGYSVMTLRLDQAAKRTALYEMFLQPSFPASNSETELPDDQLQKEEMVKVYVKKDEAQLKKQPREYQGEDVLFAVQLSATSKKIS